MIDTYMPPEMNPNISTPGAGFKMPEQKQNLPEKSLLQNLSLQQFASLNDQQQNAIAFPNQIPQNPDRMANIRALTQASAPESPFVTGPIVQTGPGSYSNIAQSGLQVNHPYVNAARSLVGGEQEKPPETKKEDTNVSILIPTPFGLLPISFNATQVGKGLEKIPKTKQTKEKPKKKPSLKNAKDLDKVQNFAQLGMKAQDYNSPEMEGERARAKASAIGNTALSILQRLLRGAGKVRG